MEEKKLYGNSSVPYNIYRSGVLQKAEIRAVVINQTNKWRKGANNIPPEIVGGL